MRNIFGQQQDRDKKDIDEFLRQYQELCKKYKMVIAPRVDVQVMKINEQQQIETTKQ